MRRLKAIFRSLNHYLISLTEIRVHGGMLRAHSHHVMDRGGVADGRYEDGLAIRLANSEGLLCAAGDAAWSEVRVFVSVHDGDAMALDAL